MDLQNKGQDMINTAEVADILHCSLATARELMYRKDFPLVKVGKNLRVERSAFCLWLSGRRV